MSAALYDLPLQSLEGGATSLRHFEGQVLLIVNVASRCGLTPQYAALESLHQQYRERGLSVLGFPCNDFGAQEPGTDAEIRDFCDSRYGVTFPLFAKVSVNTGQRHPLYQHLIAAQPQARPSGSPRLQQTLEQHGLLPQHPTDLMWNFEKFLVGRDGSVIERFAPDVVPDAPDLVSAIESALRQPPV